MDRRVAERMMFVADKMIVDWASCCHRIEVAWRSAGEDMSLPSVVYKPSLSIDGNQWCALYGENLQDGVAGFGDSPQDAMNDFNCEWVKPLPDKK